MHIVVLSSTILISIRGGMDNLYAFTFYTFIQNIFLIIFSPILSSTDTKIFIVYKELLVYIPICLFCFSHRYKSETTSQSFCLLFIITILIFNFLRPGASLYMKIVALRQLAIPFSCLFLGYTIIVDVNSIRKYLNFFVNSMIVIGVIGLIMYQFDPAILWDNLNFPTYFQNKNDAVYQSRYVNFYSWDLGVELKRLVSFIADPIATAHLIGIAWIYSIVAKNRKFWKIVVLTICAICCVSKSLAFLCFTAVLVWSYSQIRKKTYRYIFILFSIISILVLFVLATVYVGGLEENSATGNHLTSLIYAVHNNSLFGNGLGSAGYLAGVMSGGDISDEANESFFAVMMVQLGLVGVFSFYLYFLLKITQMIRIYRFTKNRHVLFAVILLADVILESVVSGSSIAMLGTGLYFIISSLIINNYSRLLNVSPDALKNLKTKHVINNDLSNR